MLILLFIGMVVLFLLPLALPWGKPLLRVTVSIWFLLWGLFFYFSVADSATDQKSEISLLIGILIFLFSAGVVLRFIAIGVTKLSGRVQDGQEQK